MNQFLSIITTLFFTPGLVSADPMKAKTISQKNSQCVVKREAGEYPQYRILKKGKAIFKPSSDGIVAALISPSGKYVALSAGEVDSIDIEPGKFEYGVVIVNCETGKKKGYRKGLPTLITKWDQDSNLHFSDSVSGQSEILKLGDKPGESLP